ncbi:FG-GAP-like repeat-containing protein [bacterium]|nr:FG-GAP-like repeat-containing protein [bacterium]
MQSSLFIAAALAVLVLAAGPAAAQLGFTEFALSDTTLNSSPETDFWLASAAPADVDGDGDLDLLVSGYYVVYLVSAEDRLTLYRNDGTLSDSTWALTPQPIDATGLFFTDGDLAWEDYDSDGDADVVVGGDGSTTLYRNDGGALHRTSTLLPTYREDNDFTTLDLQSITWADFDNDGDADLCLPSRWTGSGYQPTALLRNDGAGPGDAWTFTDIGAGLPAAANAVTAWGDQDGDGDLDLLLGNVSPWGDSFLSVYRNDAGTFAPADTGLAHIRYGMIDWGDADADGDLDIVYCGNIDLPNGTGETVVRILRRESDGSYTPVDVTSQFATPTEPWLDFTAVTWADYDSDGQVDLLVSGEWLGSEGIVGASLVYSNVGGTWIPVSEALPAPISGVAGGAFTWLDLDGEGDLDYFVAGGYYVPGGNGLIEARTQLFRNDAVALNLAPSTPAGLHVIAGIDETMLVWNPSFDDQVDSSGLTYDAHVFDQGTIPFYEGALPTNIIDAVVLPERGNVGGNTTWTLRGLPPGNYVWMVRAVDNAFNGSVAAEGEFTVPASEALAIVPLEVPSAGGLRLSSPRPNPIRARGSVVLTVDRAQTVTVTLLDVRGRRVSVLHQGPLEAGPHRIAVGGRPLPDGVYFVQARGETGQTVTRVTVLR